MAKLDRCDFRGCGNQAYREVDYFRNRRLREETARRVVVLSKEEARAYLQHLVRTSDTAWSFLCRKHFEQERGAGRIIGWCAVMTDNVGS
jgi:hypothetical protein